VTKCRKLHRINLDIFWNINFSSGTIFEICGENARGENKVLAFGERYDNLAKKIGMKKDVPALGLRLKLIRQSFKKRKVPKLKKPKIYLKT